jgi:hypothetical protein
VSDILARLYALARTLPEPPPVACFEVGKAMHDWLEATARPEGAPPEDPWRPVDAPMPPPSPIAALFGVPVVLREDLEPGAWRAIDRDGEIMKEGTL